MKTITVAVLMVSTAAICVAAKIKSQVDKSVEFSGYKTYAWGENLEPTRFGAKYVIGGFIEQELEARGLEHTTDVQRADLIVRYQAAGETDMNFSIASDPTFAAIGGIPVPGMTMWSSGLTTPSSGRYLRKGTLVIDVFDVKQHRLVWSVSASDTIHHETRKAIKQVGTIIESMFQRYPVKRLQSKTQAALVISLVA